MFVAKGTKASANSTTIVGVFIANNNTEVFANMIGLLVNYLLSRVARSFHHHHILNCNCPHLVFGPFDHPLEQEESHQ
jgi:hypothetical protein